MAIFGFLGRNKSNNSDVPADLQQYYSSDKSGLLSWILRILLFLAVLALLVWFGAWLFNKVADNDKPGSSNTATKTEQQTEQRAGQNAGQGSSSGNNSPAPALAPTPAPAAPAPPAVTPAPSAPSAPAAGAGSGANATSESLPNSGPGAVIAGIFAAASAIGAAAHSIFARRKLGRQ